MATPLNNSILKGFEVLSLFGPAQREISAAIVAEQLGMTAATAHRFLRTLEHAGALRTTKRGFYALGPAIEQLGWLAEDTGSLAAVLQPEIDALSRELNESVMVCRLTKAGPVCVAVANSNRAISVNVTIGALLPLPNTAQGRLWLSEMSPSDRNSHIETASIAHPDLQDYSGPALDAELAKIAAQGFATNLGDNEPDIAAVAVPIRYPNNKMALTLSAFGLLRRFDEALLTKALQHLTSASARIGARL